MADNYTDTTDTNFKEEPYNIDTGKPLSAAGVREALHTKETVLPVGTILAMSASSWTNTSTAFKNNWKVCDGTGGTPDLRGKFLRGGTSSDAATGGANSQTLSVPLPRHSHRHTHSYTSSGTGANNLLYHLDRDKIAAALDLPQTSTGAINYDDTYAGVDNAFITVNTVPTYYTVIYIMKVA
jgi:hypothetical protein